MVIDFQNYLLLKRKLNSQLNSCNFFHHVHLKQVPAVPHGELKVRIYSKNHIRIIFDKNENFIVARQSKRYCQIGILHLNILNNIILLRSHDRRRRRHWLVLSTRSRAIVQAMPILDDTPSQLVRIFGWKPNT